MNTVRCIFLIVSLSLMTLTSNLAHSEYITLNGVTYDDETVASLITVITSTSPIKSHPEVKYLYPAQSSLFKIPALARCKKIIVFDGFVDGKGHDATNYELYKQKVIELTQTDPYFANTELIFCEKWGHLSGTIHEAITHVETPFLFIHQHDLVLKKEFDLNGVVATMIANPNVKYVHLWGSTNKDRRWNGPVDEVVYGGSFVPLTRSFGWSDQCHVTTVDYYKNFVLPQCKFTFMENIMHPGIKESLKKYGKDAGHAPYGSYLYGNLNDGWYSMHTNGRDN